MPLCVWVRGGGGGVGHAITGGGALCSSHGGSMEDDIQFHEEKGVDSARGLSDGICCGYGLAMLRQRFRDVAVASPLCFR